MEACVLHSETHSIFLTLVAESGLAFIWLACYLLLIPVFSSVTFAPHICVSHFTDCSYFCPRHRSGEMSSSSQGYSWPAWKETCFPPGCLTLGISGTSATQPRPVSSLPPGTLSRPVSDLAISRQSFATFTEYLLCARYQRYRRDQNMKVITLTQ